MTRVSDPLPISFQVQNGRRLEADWESAIVGVATRNYGREGSGQA